MKELFNNHERTVPKIFSFNAPSQVLMNSMLWTSVAPSSSIQRGMTIMLALYLATNLAVVSMLSCGSRSLSLTGTPHQPKLKATQVSPSKL